MGTYLETEEYMNNDSIVRLIQFLESEARSCSMDFGCVTPLYVYRMWGGQVATDGIASDLKEIKNGCR